MKPSEKQQEFLSTNAYLDKVAKKIDDEEYLRPDEIDVAVNPNLMLTLEDTCDDPYEKPSWGGFIILLNAAMKIFGILPQSGMFFDKADLNQKKRLQETTLEIRQKKTWVG